MAMHTRLKAVSTTLFFVLALVAVFAGVQPVHATTVGNQEVVSLPIDPYNNQTQALVWTPDTYSTDSSSTKYPLIINLHGAGDAGTDINLLLNPALLSRRIADGFKPEAVNPMDGQNYKFIVVSPLAAWWSYSYSQIKAMLPTIIANYRVDTDRIYITGLSAGGQGSWTTVTDDATNSINISAIAPMSAATLDSSQVPNVVNAATNNIGVWSLMGSQDGFLTSTTDYTNRVNAANPVTPAKLTVINGVGHSSWIEGFDDLWRTGGMNVFEWMLTNKRGTPNPTNALPSITLSVPTDKAVIVAPNDITFTATASDTDGSIAKVEFFNGNTLLSTATTAPYTYTWTNPGVGTYNVFARATDNTGAVSNSDTARITVLAQSNVSAPYGGTARAIPGTVQAEDYDIGGQGIAYSDTTPENTGNWYRPYEGADVEIATTEPGGNQYYLGWPIAGEWQNYTVAVSQTATYAMQLRAATPYTGKSFRVDVDGVTAATVTVPQTADFTTYATNTVATLSLTAGTHVLRVIDLTDGFNINWMSFAVSNNQLPTVNAGSDQGIQSPATSATLTGSASDPDGTIVSYAWSEVSGPNTATIVAPTTASTSVNNLVAGAYVFRLTATDNGGATATDDVQITVTGVSAPYSGTPYAIPGKIEAENFDFGGQGIAYNDTTTGNTGYGGYRSTEGVDIEPTGDGTQDVGWTVGGEWMQYSVSVAQSGSYTLQSRIATPNNSDTFAVAIDGTNVTTVSVPNTGGWQSWQTVSTPNVSLTAGVHMMRITIQHATTVDEGFNINWFNFVAPANSAPTASAGTDLAITLPTTTSALSGTGSDTDGTIASYAWSFVSGPTTPTIATPTAATTNVSSLTTAGTYVFRLTVTDNAGATGTDDVNIVVSPANVPPTANAGNDQTITLPTSSVSLSGTGTDTDGTVATYLWSKVSGSGTITTPSAATTTVTALVQGVSVFRLTVTDNKGAQATDDVQVTVNAAPPVQGPYGGTARSIPGTIEAEDFDTGGLNVAYFDTTNGNSGGAYRTTESVDISAGDGGFIVGSAVAGEWTEYTVNIPKTGIYTLNVRAATTANNKSLRFDVDGTTVATVSVAKTTSMTTYKTTSATGITLNAGTRVLRIYNVADGINLNWVSFAATNYLPVVNGGTDQTITLPTSSVSLSGSATDSDGTIASYTWSKVSGGTATITFPTRAATTVTGLARGTYVFRLTAKDNLAGAGTDDVQITVQ